VAAVLFVEPSTYVSYGGSKRVLVNILTYLDREIWRPQVIFHGSGPFVDEVAALGIPVRVVEDCPALLGRGGDERAISGLPNASSASGLASLRRTGLRLDESGLPQRTGLRRLAWETRASWRLRTADVRRGTRLAKMVDGKVDLVHVNAPMHTDYAWFHAARILGAPFLTHEHEVWKRPPGAFRRVARAAVSVLCLTPERMLQVGAFCRGKAAVDLLPNGIALDRLVPRRPRAVVRAEFGLDESRILLVSAGHVQEWKGQALAIEAAGLLRDAGWAVTWILPGAEAERGYAARLRERIRALDLTDRVILLGERADMPDLFAAADMAVHTSIRPEPFGLVVIEAMLQGIPVVGPREGSLPSLLHDGTHGLLYEPRNAVSLVEAVRRLLDDPPARQRMGEAARERVHAEFDARTQARRLGAIYARVLEGRS
jgi:glycosyltransferase involved in cell wall biosynthesis